MIDFCVLSFPACEYFMTASGCSLFCMCLSVVIFSLCLLVVHTDIIHKS